MSRVQSIMQALEDEDLKRVVQALREGRERAEREREDKLCDLQEKFEGWAKANDWNLERDMSDRYEDDITRYTWQAIEALFG